MNNRMKEFRIKFGLTQEQTAEKLDIAVSTYNQLENNKRNVSLKKAKKIADLFNASINEIFFEGNIHS